MRWTRLLATAALAIAVAACSDSITGPEHQPEVLFSCTDSIETVQGCPTMGSGG